MSDANAATPASPPPADDAPANGAASPRPLSAAERVLAALGRPALESVSYLGGLAYLTLDTLGWAARSLLFRSVRFGRAALYCQMVRVGVRSVGVIALVSACIGLILAMQMAPPLAQFSQTDQVATIIAIAVVRELGPLISAIVLTGFAGALIAAEIGTMAVKEEIEALEMHALNPIRFLVLPRLLATMIAMLVLCTFGEVVAISCGWLAGVTLLDIQSAIYIDNTLNALDVADYVTGLVKAGVFGILIGAIACYNGLAVTGGASGVGRATTHTVVFSIVCIIITDLIFTAVFYKLGWT